MRNVRAVAWAACLILLVTASLSASAADKDRTLIMVAGKVNYDAAGQTVAFLEKNGITVKHVLGPEFAKYKTARHMVIIGSPGEGEGIGEILKQALTAQEIAWLSEEGNNRMHQKSDVWGKGQRIIIFAGYNARGAELARRDNRDEWWMGIAGWFDIELDQKTIYGY